MSMATARTVFSPEVLGDLEGQVVLCGGDARVRQLEGVEDLRQLAVRELDVDDGADDLEDLAVACGGDARADGEHGRGRGRGLGHGVRGVYHELNGGSNASRHRWQRPAPRAMVCRPRCLERATSSTADLRSRTPSTAGSNARASSRWPRPSRAPSSASGTSSSRPARGRARRSRTSSRRSSAGARSSSPRPPGRLQEQIFVKDLPLVAEALAAHGVPIPCRADEGPRRTTCACGECTRRARRGTAAMDARPGSHRGVVA